MTKAVATRLKISELAEQDYFKAQNEVVDLFLKQISVDDIAKMKRMARADVVTLVAEWKDFVQNDKSFKEMGRERLHEMDKHYGLIIRELWESHEALKDESKFKDAAIVAKTIAEVEHKRQDALQKAGFYDDNELTEMMVEVERKQEAIKEFLMSLVEEEPHLRNKILDALRKIEDPDYVAPVDLDVVDGDIVG